VLVPHRLRFALRPLLAWSVVVALASGAGLAVHHLARRADEERTRWGTGRTVVVATRAIPIGALVDAGNTERRALPVAALPDGAVEQLAPGTRASQSMGAGEVVVGHRLGRADAGPVAALVPAGARGVAIGGRAPRPALRSGDRVDVITRADGGLGAVVARGAPVLTIDDQVVVVAVTPAEVAEVAAAALDGTAVLAVSGSASPGG
jgi:Flp pilus assembly protein CpaB